MEKKTLFNELSLNEAADIFGGDWLKNMGHNAKVCFNRACNAVEDFLTPADVQMSETLMNCI